MLLVLFMALVLSEFKCYPLDRRLGSFFKLTSLLHTFYISVLLISRWSQSQSEPPKITQSWQEPPKNLPDETRPIQNQQSWQKSPNHPESESARANRNKPIANKDLYFTLLFLLEHIYLSRTLSYHSQTCFNIILKIYLNEKLNFYHHILMILENLVY